METQEAYALVTREFECYYQADELTWNNFALSELAKYSAERLFFYSEGKDVHVLISVLQQAKSERDGSFVKFVERETNVDWGDAEHWELFKNQKDMISRSLQNMSNMVA
ncbi:hypothetical protein GCM10007907_36970 [Chitinimonas prasina]|uniref:CdiI immunity protein domain-containing protein n=1 Tax=Chitinimonas prasina TaxID=1434937 RepID=A0ABQ5YMD3_9NEIS|nr:hypothetical protein [Chitinimonas prasina]GLR14907.1 hypothetical protein GCM10007907_36970 [Chitinimonas prasina]